MLRQPTAQVLIILALANDEAWKRKSELVAPEDLLAGLLRDASSLAADLLARHRVKLRPVIRETAALDWEPLLSEVRRGAGIAWTGPALPFSRDVALSPRSHRAFVAAARLAHRLGHGRLSAEHLLLALLIDEQDSVAKIILRIGEDPAAIRADLFSALGVDLAATNVKQVLSYATVPGYDRPEDRILQVGIVGVSGYGGGEVLRLCATHPMFHVVYVAGEASAGQRLDERFPGIGELGTLAVQKWDPARVPDLDMLFASLPSGDSTQALAQVRPETRIVDLGGDHRFVDGWMYGLADVWPEQIRGVRRLANPGCYPAASLAALAPLVAEQMIDPTGIIIDAKSGVSGAGRGGGTTLGFAEANEDVAAYSLLNHAHAPEMTCALSQLAGASVLLTFTPHLVPMTRGILATCYARGTATTQACLEAARRFYEGRPFVRVVDKPPHTKWATGSNLVYVSYAADPDRQMVIALAAIDNLGKGAAGQAVQNANLMLGLPETAGLEGAPLWP